MVEFEIVVCYSGVVPVALKDAIRQKIIDGTDTLQFQHVDILDQDNTR